MTDQDDRNADLRLRRKGSRRRRLVVVLLLLAAYVTIVAGFDIWWRHGDTLERQARIYACFERKFSGQEIRRLHLDVDFRPEAHELTATATVTLLTLAEGRRHFYLALHDEADLKDVLVDGRACKVRRNGVLVRIAPPEMPRLGEPLDVTLRYDLTFEDARENGPTITKAPLGWYPQPLRGLSDIELTVRLSPDFTFIETGQEVASTVQGGMREIRQIWPRPISGVSLIAGHFNVAQRTVEGRSYVLYWPAGVECDAERLLQDIGEIHERYTRSFGPNGYNRCVVVLLPAERLASEGDDGVVLMSLRAVRAPDYGYATLAHEVAHQWWGSVIRGDSLAPKRGGEWLVEGFAEMSELWVVEQRVGTPGAIRALDQLHDIGFPDVPVSGVSHLTKEYGDKHDYEAVYTKGSAVATLLRRALGDAAFADICRQFLTEHRYEQVSTKQFRRVAERVSGRNLDAFFGRWVDGTGLTDFAVEATGDGTSAVVRNVGEAVPHMNVDVAVLTAGGPALYALSPLAFGEPQRGVLNDPDTRLIVDPLLTWPDPHRSNNMWPRRWPVRWEVPAPRGPASARVLGLPSRWEPSRVEVTDASGRQYAYAFDRALLLPPRWTPDAKHLLVELAPPRRGKRPEMYWLPTNAGDVANGDSTSTSYWLTDGWWGSIRSAAPFEIFYGRDGDLWRLRPGKRPEIHLIMRDWQLRRPVATADGSRLHCWGLRGRGVALWTWDVGNPEGARKVWEGMPGRPQSWWLPDDRRILGLVGFHDRRALILVDANTAAAKELVTDFELLGHVAITPAGQVLFTGQKERTFPEERYRLYLLDPDTGQRAEIPVPGMGADESVDFVAYAAGTGEIVVVVERRIPEFPSKLWAERRVVRIPTPDADRLRAQAHLAEPVDPAS